jgi:hypothetical protein
MCIRNWCFHEFMTYQGTWKSGDAFMLSWIHDLARYMKIRWCYVFTPLGILKDWSISLPGTCAYNFHEFMNSWLNKVHENQVMLSWIHDLSRYMKIRWCVFVYIWMVEEFQIYFICTAEFFWEFFGNSKVFLFLTFSKSADCLHFKSQLIVYTLKFSWLFKF